jgi:hypothetical protein
MIQSDSQLQQALDQMANLCRAVESLRAEVFPKNPRNFAILAEGPVDEIRKLQVDVDDYLTRLEDPTSKELDYQSTTEPSASK